MSKSRQSLKKKRRRQEQFLILSLLSILVSLLVFLFILDTPRLTLKNWPSVFSLVKQSEQEPRYQKNQAVVLSEEIKEDIDNSYFLQVARIKKISRPKSIFDQEIQYSLLFSDGQVLEEVSETALEAIDLPLDFDQKVELISEELGSGYVTGIYRSNKTTNQLTYKINFPDSETSRKVPLSEISPIYSLPLSESNNGLTNQRLLQEVINKSRQFSFATIDFPQGEYLIGSSDDNENYLLLSSNIWFRGNGTTLLVDGASRWFGLATGPGAYDGVSNFSMTGLDIRAKDLEKGAKLLIMPNHGSNWYISDNTFTMVHALGSHVFDLGGLQDSTFYQNKFIGYAPELTHVTTIEGRIAHDFYAEAIQLDVSDANVAWDGGLMSVIDENYFINSQQRLMSANIIIAYNEFLPYLDETGELKAYGASLGQHSSEVGYVAIYGNVFKNSLVKNYRVDGELSWFFEPILIRSFEPVDIYSNEIIF